MVFVFIRVLSLCVWISRVGLLGFNLVQRSVISSFLIHGKILEILINSVPAMYDDTAWDHADVMYVADYDILVLITIASAILLLTFLVGFTGTILNSRPILALYALLLWPALISILTVGYPSYKRYAFSLDRKLNLAWSQWYTPLGRLIIQDSLHCCGFYSALHSFTPSKRCFSRTQLPGCKAKLYNFEHTNLYNIWSMAFSLVPLHILNIFVSLLCANHVTKTFGKGITPKQYRLSGADVKADAEKIFGAIKDASRVVHPPPAISRPPLYGIFREDRKGSRTSLLGDHSGVAFEEVDDGRDAGEAVPLSTSNVLSSRSSSTGFLSYNPWTARPNI